MKRKKRSLTLLEIMVVIFIIGIIGTVIGVNMKGSLEEGKAFKSEKGSKQIYEILTLEISKGNLDPMEMNLSEVHNLIRHSGFAADLDKLLVDGWGRPYQIMRTEDGDDLRVCSQKFFTHLQGKGQRIADIRNKYPWMNGTDCVEIEETR